MLTQEAVIAQLAVRGYEATPRRLVDWREKALLPPLVKRGQGQGRGWVYVWEDPRIVEQVIAVQELLWIYERTGWLYVPLWCLGFDVPLERVKSHLLIKLERKQAFLTGGEQDRDELGFRLSKLATTEVTRPGPRRGRSQESADVLEYWLNLVAGDAEYSPDPEAWAQIAAAIATFGGSGAQDATGTGKHLWTPSTLWLIRRWTRRYVSIPRLEEAARNATDADWSAVQADWQALARLVDAIRGYARDDVWEESFSFWLRVVAIAGPWVTLVNLSMRWHGQGQVWDNIRKDLWCFKERFDTDLDLQHQMRLLWQETIVSGESAESTTGH